MTLADLRELFENARIEAVTSARFTRASCPANTCRYCGLWWVPVFGTRLDGHARCIVPLDFIEAVTSLWRSDPKLTVQAIADALDVSKATVTSWCSSRRKAGWDSAARGRP